MRSFGIGLQRVVVPHSAIEEEFAKAHSEMLHPFFFRRIPSQRRNAYMKNGATRCRWKKVRREANQRIVVLPINQRHWQGVWASCARHVGMDGDYFSWRPSNVRCFENIGIWGRRFHADYYPSAFRVDNGLSVRQSGLRRHPSSFSGFGSVFGLFSDSHKSQDDGPRFGSIGPSKETVEAEYVPTWAVPCGFFYVFLGMLFIRLSGDSRFVKVCGFLCGLIGGVLILTGYDERQPQDNDERNQIFQHNSVIVQQKLLTLSSFRYTLITRGLDMANVLNTDKQIAVIGALAEGSSIRSIERITGIHRDTIMRLGVKVGQGCTALMDAKMRNLPCRRLEMDEIWGFVGKKERHVREGDSGVGSVWTFCAIDAETKLVPAFRVGNRDAATANAFVRDVAERMAYRVQLSTDGLNAYVNAVESAFGGNADYAQIIKVYGQEEASNNRRYSAPEFVSSEKKVISGRPNLDLISTSYVERLNATTRLHMRRLTRLTLAFSKKRENFEAAVGLHFAYYNFVKRHNTLRCTPAMAAGVTGSFWSVGDLLEAAA